MKYYQVRELKSDEGTYHYTCRRDDLIWALGYCGGEPLVDKEEWADERSHERAGEIQEGSDGVSLTEHEKRAISDNKRAVERFGEKYHACGHESRQEAIECYTEYVLDQKTVYHHTEGPMFKAQESLQTQLTEPTTDVPVDVKGEECRHPECYTMLAYPTMAMRPGGSTGHRYYLCSSHCNRDSVEEWFMASKKTISSY